MKLNLKSHAKINLALNVTGKNKSLHKIESIISFIDLHDVISIKKMEKKPYHHLSDGSFRNPKGSPERDSNFKWSFKIFNKEKKKLNLI